MLGSMGGPGGTDLPVTSLGILCFSAVNFDHFQILRAIGKGSFGKVSGAGRGQDSSCCWTAVPFTRLGLSHGPAALGLG